MQIATLVIAVIAVVLAALSLTWQAATYFLSGPRIRVSLREGLRGPGGVVVAPPQAFTASGRQALNHQGYTEHVLAVEATNRGRMPATINGWSVVFGNGASYSLPSGQLNPDLPYRLEPFTSATWYLPADHVQRLQRVFTDQADAAAQLRGLVDVAGRGAIRSRNYLTVRSDSINAPARRALALKR